jgi:hypothetical protein
MRFRNGYKTGDNGDFAPIHADNRKSPEKSAELRELLHTSRLHIVIAGSEL